MAVLIQQLESGFTGDELASIDQAWSFWRTCRQALLRFYALLTGMAVLLQVMQMAGVLASIPATYLLPFLPLIPIGMALWLLQGQYRTSLAQWIVLSVPVIGLLWTQQPLDGLLLVLCFVAMISFAALIADSDDWQIAARWHVIGSLLAYAFLIYEWQYPVHPKIESMGRLGAVFDASGRRIIEPNQVATHASVTLLVALSLLTLRSRRHLSRSDFMLGIAGVLGSAAVVLLSQSRGVLVAMVVAVAATVVLGKAITDRRTWMLGFVTGIAGGAFLWMFGAKLLERFTISDVSSANGRTQIWASAIELATSNVQQLVIGAGTGGGPAKLGRFDWSLEFGLSVLPRQVGRPGFAAINSHNAGVEWLLNFGLIGLLFGGIALVLMWLRAREIDRGSTLAIGQSMIVVFLVISLTLVAYRMVGVSIACGGMTLGYLYHRRMNTDAPQFSDELAEGSMGTGIRN